MNHRVFTALLIGAGQIGVKYSLEKRRGENSSHLSALTNHSGFQLTAIVDPDENNLQQSKAIFNLECETQTDLQELKNKSFDLVVVASPGQTHFEVLKKILNDFKVKLILCEKPGASSANELLAIEALAQKKNVSIAMNYTRRWAPSFIGIAQDIKEKLTTDSQFVCHYTKGLLNYASHQIDFLRQIDSSWELKHKLTAEENPSFVLESSKGARATFIGLKNESLDYEVWSIQAYLKDLYIELRAGGVETSKGLPKKDLFFNNYNHLEISTKTTNNYLTLKTVYEDIYLNLISPEHHPRCTLKDAIEVLKLTDKVLTKEDI
jgi:hypothetical protein